MDPSECDHPVQFNGMCGVCGADVTDGKYHSEGLEAALQTESFQVSHDSSAIREARRLDDETRQNLLDSRRLALIVDLDQTIIHTTVDPTVGEWMDEIATSGAGETDNPNAEALRDVARFKVPDDAPPGWKGVGADRWYYTKPRPGLKPFLQRITQLYELHVYTMGTRSYANAVCEAIDPTGEFFADRILSRDENSSLKNKDLKRLFPTDQSMVVIIDDRSDVWNDSPNLVKVVPYNFFLGVGDINGTFLPPQPLTLSSAAPSSPGTPEVSKDITPEQGLEAHARLMDKVSEERPLAKMQEQLEADTKDDVRPDDAVKNSGNGSPAAGIDTQQAAIPAARPLLSLEDNELDRVADVLTRIHTGWYRFYGMRPDADSPLPWECHVENLIDRMKRSVFHRCTFLFSGIFPSHLPPQTTRIWNVSQAFGAQCTTNLNDSSQKVTHCITANPQTEKSLRAKAAGAYVVWQEWLWKCAEQWARVPEDAYRADVSGAVDVVDAEVSRPTSKDGEGSRGNRSTTPTIEPPPPNLDFVGAADGAGGSGEGLRSDGEGVVDELNLGDEEFAEVGKAWDDAAQAELDEFLLGSDDEEYTDDGERSRSGSQAPDTAAASRASTPPSTPGGRKRVRYADEESLPLESCKEPSPPGAHDEDEDANEPRKRRKPLLLLPAEDGDIDASHRFQWTGRQRRELEQQAQAENGLLSAGRAGRDQVLSDAIDFDGAGDDEDDDLAALLAEEVANHDD